MPDDRDDDFEDDADALLNADPNCEHAIVLANGGGIRCTKCPGWFCY